MNLKIGQKIYTDKDVDECEGDTVFATLGTKGELVGMVQSQIKDFPDDIDEECFEFYELEVKRVVQVRLQAKVTTKE